MCGLALKAAQAGELYNFETKQIVPHLPDPELRRLEKRIKTTDPQSGNVCEEDVEETANPRTMEGVRTRWRIFRTTTMMAINTQPQHQHLQCWHSRMEKFYHFIDGPRQARQ